MASCSSANMELPDVCLGGLPSVPECFRCPVTRRVMEDPVCLSDGRICDRSSVGRLGYAGAVMPNKSLREAIRSYFELRKDVDQMQDEWRTYLAPREEKAKRKMVFRWRQMHAMRTLLEQSRQAVRDMKEKQVSSASSAAPTTEASTPEATPIESPTTESPRSETQAQAQAEEEPSFRSGPAPRANSAAERPRPLRRASWSGFLPGRRAAKA